jgi:hypothetical protein
VAIIVFSECDTTSVFMLKSSINSLRTHAVDAESFAVASGSASGGCTHILAFAIPAGKTKFPKYWSSESSRKHE